MTESEGWLFAVPGTKGGSLMAN